MSSKLFYQLFILLFLLINTPLLKASTLPDNYEGLKGCEKQELLWSKINSSVHKKLPKFKNFGLPQLLAMVVQKMTTKVATVSDVAPKGWKKHLHRRGVVAKVKFVSNGKHSYSGIFKGADCALLRLSLTFKPTKKRGFAPGLALKVLRDSVPSGNVSALYTLDGQAQDFNFFQHELSNIVPIGSSLGQKVVHNIFERVTDYPEQLQVSEMASINSAGKKAAKNNSPVQVFFVPNSSFKGKLSSKKHDMRDDLMGVQEGVAVYKVFAVPAAEKAYDYYKYSLEVRKKFLESAIPLGEIVTTSKFLASEFGDTKIFFKHQKR